MTVKELYNICEKELKEGNGNKDIVLCVNGDEFYLLNNGFSTPNQNCSKIEDTLKEWEANKEDMIVLN